MDEYQSSENEVNLSESENKNMGTPPPVPENPFEAKQTEKYDIPPMRPNNWLWQSIVVTILCCSPLAIVGIVYAARVNGLYDSGRFDEAKKAAKIAKIWTLVALALGIIYMIYATIIMMHGDVPTDILPSDGGPSIYNY